MSSSLLSIVIPCKNEEKQLQQTLTAIDQQSFDMDNCPIYIADAGSSDRTLDIIADFQKNTCM
jgi:glycosyltransferase involved in cell wall biosynthesis